MTSELSATLSGQVLVVIAVVAVAIALFFVLRQTRRQARSRPRYSADETYVGPLLASLAGTASPQLVCIAGDLKGQRFPLKVSRVTLGRHPDNVIMIDGDLVSRHHACIERHGSQFMLHDQDSTNGTYINGQQIAQHLLVPGDQIQIGPAVFVFTPASFSGVLPSQPIRVADVAPLPVRAQVYDFGEYVRTGVLGEGGVAVVFKGYARRDPQQVVAIKVLTTRDPYFRDKFQHEIELGKTLLHPHITRMFGGACRDNVWYMVMEFNDAGSLRDRLGGGRMMSLEETISIIGQTCDALNYAHRRGIYHRDVKPENVMFSSVTGVKLGDFGIARIASRRTITQNGVLIGTAPYMSFEQAKGWSDIDGRSDLYSLGIVLYELTTGQLPFTGDPLTIIEQHLRYCPPPPSHLNPSLPIWVDDVVMRALEKDRSRRFQTAEEMARAVGYREPIHDGDETVIQTPQAPAKLVAQSGHPRLVVLVGGRPGGQVLLTEQSIELGRESGVFATEDPVMSRRHARIFWNRYNWMIEDLGSANGTFVNNQRIWQPEVLLPGALITLGDTQLRFEV